MNEAEVLFGRVLNCNRADLYLDSSRKLTESESGVIASVFKRRLSGEPLEYILGSTEFMGLRFKVNPDVLIPRPETEILVETVIRHCEPRRGEAIRSKILDLGTGSGCIAVSLAKFMPDAEITAADISEEALKVAAENAAAHNVKINFICSDLFTGYGVRGTGYDMIISNPPYVPSEEIGQLQREVRAEPAIALDGGRDGLEFYRRIINDCPAHLEAGGLLIMEIGFDQCKRIENIFKKSKNFEIIEIVKDYNRIDRVIAARREAWIS